MDGVCNNNVPCKISGMHQNRFKEGLSSKSFEIYLMTNIMVSYRWILTLIRATSPDQAAGKSRPKAQHLANLGQVK